MSMTRREFLSPSVPGTYTEIETNCKFCSKPLTLKIDPEYAALGDSLKLIRLASCNDCADARESMRSCVDSIAKACRKWGIASDEVQKSARIVTRDKLTKLVVRYLEHLEKVRRKASPGFDKEVIELLLEHPDRWPDILKQFVLV